MAGLVEALLRLEPARLEADYRSRESPRDYIEPPLAIRLDGVNFGTVLSDLPGPRNRGVHNALKIAAADLASSNGADLAYIVSDEVNLVFRATAPYRGRVLKLISVLASSLSAKVSMLLDRPLRFDARVVKLYDDKDAARYIAYRARVGLNNYAISIARLKGLVDSSTPPIGEILKSLRGEDLSLGWGTLLLKERRWLEVDICEFLAGYGLC